MTLSSYQHHRKLTLFANITSLKHRMLNQFTRNNFGLSLKKYTRNIMFLWLTIACSFSQYAISQANELTLEKCEREIGKPPVYGAECGVIQLPENAQDPSSPLIDIHVLRLPAIQNKQLPPVFFISGGPGQGSTSLAPLIRRQFSGLLKDRDLVFVDQRGTGQSNPLKCETDPFQYAELTPDEATIKSNQAMAKCFEQYDANLPFYTTYWAVQDLEAIRKALAYQTINLWGASYGTRVILEYLRQSPESINSAVLDGVAPVAIALPKHAAEDSSYALRRLLASCNDNTACTSAFGNIEHKWQNLLQSLQESPQKVQLSHPRTAELHEVYVDHVVISGWLRFSLYVRDLSSIIPLAIDNASKGDFSTLFSMQAIGLDSATSGIAEGMQMNLLCREDNYVDAIQEKTEQPPKALLFANADINNFEAICATIGAKPEREDYYLPLQSNVPTLLLSGNIDPATPPKWAEHVKPGLTESLHIVVPGGHHNVSGLGCMPKIIKQFFDQSTIENIDTTCVDAIKIREFFIDGAGPQLTQFTSPSSEKVQ